jgi:hypothetical protein
MVGRTRVEALGLVGLLVAAVAACSADPGDDQQQQAGPEQQIGEARSASSSSGWRPLGGDLNPFPGQPVSAPSLLVDPAVGQVIGFSAIDPATSIDRVFVLRWSHPGWASIGEAFDGGGPSLASGERAGLHVCFAPPASSSAGGPIVLRWTHRGWAPVGGDIGAETGFETTRYVLDACGGIQLGDRSAPIVAWAAEVGPKNDRVYAAEWRRGSGEWAGLGPGAIGVRPAAVSLAVGSHRGVYLATFTPGGSYGGGATTQAWS